MPLHNAHVILLGDSIFDNGGYVEPGRAVHDHFCRCLPSGSRATLLAVDGAVSADVASQLARLPADATHLIISVGGNDALPYASLIRYERAETYLDVADHLATIQQKFRLDYQTMLRGVLARGLPVAVCTVYNAIPGLTRAEACCLSLFNDVILLEAFRAGFAVLDLRLLCTDPDDYAACSPIEPSAVGGGKIARAISRLLEQCDFKSPQSRVFF